LLGLTNLLSNRATPADRRENLAINLIELLSQFAQRNRTAGIRGRHASLIKSL
jgi:hypothetical protein